jgi:hypothetical protein
LKRGYKVAESQFEKKGSRGKKPGSVLNTRLRSEWKCETGARILQTLDSLGTGVGAGLRKI